MKKLFKILGLVLGIIIILVLAAAAFIHFRGVPTYTAEKIEIKVEATPERVAQGEKIAGMLCVHCHSDQSNMMTGRRVTDIPDLFGEIYSMNITHDSSVGIGKWTDGELVYFLRTGLRSDGTYAPPYMPKFPLLSDEDVYSIVAWLRSDAPSLKASKVEPPKSVPSFFTKFLTNVAPAAKPFPFPKEAIKQPDTTNAVAWGKYLSNNLYACFACHSADFAKNNDLKPEESEGFYGGGNKLIGHNGKEVFSKNITPDAATGIGSWTEDDFITAIRSGKRKNGKMFAYPMVPYTRLTDGELKAMFAYLKTVPTISNKVEENN